KIGGLDRFFNFVHRALVVWRDHYQARLGRRQPGQLPQRGLRAVVIYLQIFDQRGGSAAGADAGEFVAKRLHRLVHFLARVFDCVRKHAHGALSTRVPIRSPITALLILPALRKLNTMIGSRLSMHIEMAVESITFRFFCSTSMYVSRSKRLAPGSRIGSRS